MPLKLSPGGVCVTRGGRSTVSSIISRGPFSSGGVLCFSCSAENTGAQRGPGPGMEARPSGCLYLPQGSTLTLRPQPSPTPAPSVSFCLLGLSLPSRCSSWPQPPALFSPLPPLKGDFIPTLLHSSPTGRADRFLNLHISPKGVLSPRSQPKPKVSVLQTPNSSWLLEALTAPYFHGI